MTHTEQVIKEAYEAGYKPAWIDKNVTEHWFGISEKSTLSISQTLLDAEFWKFCGKARGWTNSLRCPHCATAYKPKTVKYGVPGWIYFWHRFIDFLAEGKTAEDYFASLMRNTGYHSMTQLSKSSETSTRTNRS